MRDDHPVRAGWDDVLEMWSADADPGGPGDDPAIGPAGPAGVVVLRSPAATVSQCTITGRVTSLWFERELGDADRQLLALFLGADDRSLDGADPDRPLDLEVLPVRDRIDVARLAGLLEAEAAVGSGPPSAARFLWHAELAEVCAAVSRRAPALISPDRARHHLDSADRLAEDSRWQTLSDGLPPGVSFDPLPTAQVLATLDATLAEHLGSDTAGSPARRLLQHSALHLDNLPLTAGPLGAVADPEPAFRSRAAAAPAPVSHPPVFAPDLRAITNPSPEEGQVALEVEVGPDGGVELGDLAPRQVGLQGTGGRLEVHDLWATFTVPLAPDARHPLSWWAVGKLGGDDPAPIGAAPFTLVGGLAIAQFAVASARVDRLAVVAHPLRPSATSRLAQLDAADRLGRAAWWGHRLYVPDANTWLAHAALAWFELGRVLRAGWAWQLGGQGGQDEIRRLLTERADGAGQAIAASAMTSVLVSGRVPRVQLTEQVPMPAWLLAFDLGAYARSVPGVG